MALRTVLYLPQTTLTFTITLIRVLLIITFLVKSRLRFYILFEFSLLPIIFIVLVWGYQPERLRATYALALYTITASFPLLLWVLILSGEGPARFRLWPSLVRSLSVGQSVTNLIICLRFLVKLPMFAVHLWLPKAHVEAPVFASIILAALLLKLGGYGLWRLNPLSLINNFRWWIQIIALIGGGLISILCTRQTDIKVIIAYSSVAHIRFVVTAYISQTRTGIFAALALMVAHGISSSAIFMGANIIYLTRNTRRILFSHGYLNILPIFTLFWFFLCLINIATPPTVNFLAEVLAIITTYALNWTIAIPIALLRFFSAVYTLILYACTQQGQPAETVKSAFKLTPVHLLRLASHTIYGFIVVTCFI